MEVDEQKKDNLVNNMGLKSYCKTGFCDPKVSARDPPVEKTLLKIRLFQSTIASCLKSALSKLNQKRMPKLKKYFIIFIWQQIKNIDMNMQKKKKGKKENVSLS